MGNKTYYDILNVKNSASEYEIKSAFRELIKVWHPDLHPGDTEAVNKTQEINEAYNVLSDRKKRAEYDRTLNAPYTQTENTHYEQGGYEQPKQEAPRRKISLFGKMVVLLPLAAIWVFFSYKNHLMEEDEYRLHVVFLPLMLILLLLAGIYAEVKRRDDIAQKRRAVKLGGIDSIVEVEKWLDRFINSGISLTECRNDFFKFSVRADQHLLLRFNSLSKEDRERYKDTIELLEYVIDFRMRNA